MKKFWAVSLISLFSLVASACWYTISNFNATYIASVNGKQIHYTPVNSLVDTVYHNGMTVDLPIAVQIKVSDRYGDQPGESIGPKQVIEAKLQYKVVRKNGTIYPFTTVKTISNPKWTMNFSNPVNLFGANGVIDIPATKISAGDEIIIRVYFSDGTYHTGNLSADIKPSDVPDTQSYSLDNISCGNGGWKAPHVFRVKFSGKRRKNI